MVERRLGPYRLVRKLADGASSFVVEAVDERTGARVALKVPHPDRQATLVERAEIESEARRVGGLDHPNVVRLLDVVTGPSTVALALELVDGVDAAALLAAGPLSAELTAILGWGAAAGLSAVHEAVDAQGRYLGLVHGDVAPRNVLVSVDGHVKLTDFGLSRRRAVSMVTSGGVVRGTPGYVAPEVVRGASASPASDVFGLGMVLHELLTGRPVFDGPAVHVLRATVEQPVPPLPGELGAVVGHATRKRPENRFRSARELAEALAALADPAHATELARRVQLVRR